MKIQILLASCLLAVPLVHLRGAEPSAATPAAPSAAPTTPKVEDQLNALVQRAKAKLNEGADTEAALAGELKEFDALVAQHKSEKTDAVAGVALAKAALYIEVFENYDKGVELLRQIRTDFPGTQVAERADGIIAQVQAQKDAQARRAQLKEGTAFPDFAEKDLAGQPLSVGKFKGKVVLVDFWATWCGPCMEEMPNVQAAYAKYHDKGFEIVGISLDENADALKKTLAEKNMTWPQYFDGKGWDGALPQRYGIVAQDLRGPQLDAALQKLITN